MDQSESDIGFRLAGGLEFELGAGLVGVLAASYSTVDIEGADVEWMSLEGGLSFHL